MTHALCDGCETAETCWRNQSCFEPIEWQAAHGLVPIEEYDARTPRAFLSLPDILIAAAAVLICAFVGAVVIARWMGMVWFN
jgi:hypothetical protein